MKRIIVLAAVVSLLFLTACSSGGTDGYEPAPMGIIEGSIVINNVVYGEKVDLQPGTFVPGELIVRFEDNIFMPTSTLQVAGMQLQAIRPMALPNTMLYQVGNGNLGEAMSAMSTMSHIRYAHPNYILKPYVEPNDTQWVDNRSALWNYDVINMPAAWDISTGGKGIVVAVLDTQVREHKEFILGENILEGKSFVSTSGNPGNHGTHVAGTIAAKTNNAQGIPGVGWDTKILPVEVLTTDGGTLDDVVEGMLWSVNLLQNEVNPHVADVINMSIGGLGSCYPYFREALERIADETDAVVVVAAGNDTMDVAGVTPAGCPDVITVAAAGFTTNAASGRLAEYSNFGAGVDIIAPGGDSSGGVLSTISNNKYGYMSGTSMAAPHVSGVVALMKAIVVRDEITDPPLNTETVRRILQQNALKWTDPVCHKEQCTEGFLDAERALNAVANQTFAPKLQLDMNSIDFEDGAASDEQILTVKNVHTDTLVFDIEIEGADTDWLNAADTSGGEPITLKAGEEEKLWFQVDRVKLGEGRKSIMVTLRTPDDEILQKFPIFAGTETTRGDLYVFSLIDDPQSPGNYLLTGAYRSSSDLLSYRFRVEPAPHQEVYAFLDTNRNGNFEVGDYCGVAYIASVQADRTTRAPDIVLNPILSAQDMCILLQNYPTGGQSLTPETILELRLE